MEENSTYQKIQKAALVQFYKIGIKKTSMEDIAASIGITRMTVYRYCSNKEDLVSSAFALYTDNLKLKADLIATDIKLASGECLMQIKDLFRDIPKGDFPSIMIELKKLYPQLWKDFHKKREDSITKIMEHILSRADIEGRLRKEVNSDFFRFYFTNSIIPLLISENIKELNIDAEAIFTSMIDLLQYGIYKHE